MTRRLVLLVLLLAIAAAIGACTLFDSDPPPNTCTKNDDCFRAQGEVCNLQKHVCEPRQDGGVDAP